ncbi:MAG TPA: hypothetical protein VIL36_10885 [Acidimicrobiales bacterium]
MRDPFGVWTSGRLQVVCQIIHVEHVDKGTVVDLVTLEPCDRGLERVPAGTPLSLGFGSEPATEAQLELEAIMTHWEQGGALLDLEVDDVPNGLRYQFRCGDEQLILLVDASA